uniref:Uncharacterized protein n=1 Tax=Rhizophora mucronata TaxID=61149 RepID=A0A2P2PNM4_RHIMU
MIFLKYSLKLRIFSLILECNVTIELFIFFEAIYIKLQVGSFLGQTLLICFLVFIVMVW